MVDQNEATADENKDEVPTGEPKDECSDEESKDEGEKTDGENTDGDDTKDGETD